ncbi:MAG TPA: hydroxymethylglutaryl-CoA lyase [Planctomycetota bacterium]|nr:hydroxymethylglutaryl-CoA lyase [Planctomycetota bacterium]
MPEHITIVETPRDAFQGLPRPIPTAEKIRYIQSLRNAGFKHIDLGSFVSPKAVPQMADSENVVRAFSSWRDGERIAIIVNEQGLDRALSVGGLDAIGFPLSLSAQFQLQNTKATPMQVWPMLEKMISRIEQHDMSFILYLSMAFGNPYGEKWDEEELFGLIRRLCAMGIRHISLADTVALARPEQVSRIFKRAVKEQPKIEFSAHFHGRPENWFDCVDAALNAGCRRFDAASGGLGGCPFAQDGLVANIPSDQLARRLTELGFVTGIDLEKADCCSKMAREFQALYGKA